jgi:hypothetical protein
MWTLAKYTSVFILCKEAGGQCPHVLQMSSSSEEELMKVEEIGAPEDSDLAHVQSLNVSCVQCWYSFPDSSQHNFLH